MQTLLKANAIITQQIQPDLYRRFIDYLDATPNTATTYTRALKQLARYLEGKEQPTRLDILAYKNDLEKSHKPATVQLYLITARLFFRWTAQEGIYPDIADHIKGPKLTKGFKKDYLTANQVAAILSQIDRTSLTGLRDYAILALMVSGGLRDIEICRADIDDMRQQGSQTVLYIQGKGRTDKQEYIKVSQPVEAAIRSYLKARHTKGALFTSESNNSKDQRLTTRSISRIVKNRLKAAGYESNRLTAHSLRHTAITLALLSGEPIDQVAQFARHASINTTMVYNHALDLAANSCAEAVSSQIFKG